MTAMIDLLRRFFAWWAGELSACVPLSLRRRLRRRRKLLLFAVDEDEIRLRLREGDRWRELGAVALSEGALHEADESLHRRLRATRGAEVAVALPPHRVLRRLVQLPAAAMENLREVLSFEMDRHTPLRAEEAAFDYRILSSDREAKRISLELAVAKQDVVERAVALAKAFGCSPRMICADVADLDSSRPMNLLALPDAPLRSASRLSAALLILAVLLAATAVYLPLRFKQDLLASYEARLTESRAAAMAVDGLIKELAAAEERERFLVDRKRSEPAVTALINEVSLRLPQDTWLVQFDLRGRAMELSGLSPHASSLIAEIEGSDMLAEVKFAAPVVTDTEFGLEKFQLSATVAEKKGN